MRIRTFKKGDFILILVIAIGAALLFVWNHYPASGQHQVFAVITQDGQVVREVSLEQLGELEDMELQSNGVDLTIRLERGRIRFSASTCPDQICVHSGWLSQAGDRAVCLPAKVVVKVLGQSNGAPDSVAY
ncbi:MAG: NusG domain II-containing protein [Peptococcaceae bacterium]|jgi:hypothetical protein|nr:NusG domain II-containing protein [Peptococcaceae bacterium]